CEPEAAPGVRPDLPVGPLATQVGELGLEPVVIARAQLLALVELGDEARDAHERAAEEVRLRAAERTERRQAPQRLDGLVDARVAIEALAPQRRVVIAAADQIAARRQELLARRAALAPQDAAHALRRAREHELKPRRERAGDQLALLLVAEHVEGRIDAGLHRPLAQQIGAEGVDGADARGLELGERGLEALPLFVAGRR